MDLIKLVLGKNVCRLVYKWIHNPFSVKNQEVLDHSLVKVNVINTLKISWLMFTILARLKIN